MQRFCVPPQKKEREREKINKKHFIVELSLEELFKRPKGTDETSSCNYCSNGGVDIEKIVTDTSSTLPLLMAPFTPVY